MITKEFLRPSGSTTPQIGGMQLVSNTFVELHQVKQPITVGTTTTEFIEEVWIFAENASNEPVMLNLLFGAENTTNPSSSPHLISIQLTPSQGLATIIPGIPLKALTNTSVVKIFAALQSGSGPVNVFGFTNTIQRTVTVPTP